MERMRIKPQLIVGHSYGASAAQALGEKLKIKTRAYGTPAYTRGNILERLVSPFVRPAADALKMGVGAAAGAAAGELAGPLAVPFAINASDKWLQNLGNRLENNIPKDTIPQYTVRFKRANDPVGALDDKARLGGGFNLWGHSAKGWNTESNQDIDARCMIDERFCTPTQRQKIIYRKDPSRRNAFFRGR
jgi:hypothetical protein